MLGLSQAIALKLQILLKAGKVACITLLLINLILLVDVYFLPKQTIFTSIIESNVIDNDGAGEFNIHSSTGRFWTIQNTGYETSGAKIKYTETKLFKIGFNIYNLDRNYRILRKYDAYTMSRFCSILFILIATVGLIYMPIGNNQYYATIVLILAVSQDILLLL